MTYPAEIMPFRTASGGSALWLRLGSRRGQRHQAIPQGHIQNIFRETASIFFPPLLRGFLTLHQVTRAEPANLLSLRYREA
jgi:hypothetical protein